MATQYVGEIRMFAGNFAPVGWQLCDGSLLPIAGNEALFQLLGTTYGGNGQNNFAVPDLRGRLPLHQGNGFVLGQAGGAETVTLTAAELPAHGHGWIASANASTGVTSPAGAVLARTSGADVYSTDITPVPLSPEMVSAVGRGYPHDNMQPYLSLNFIIALFGIFPSPT